MTFVGRRFLLIPAIAGLLGCMANPLLSQPEQDSVPVLVSVSGGISLGAYEAGLNWALVEFLRASKHPDFRRSVGLGNSFFYLGTATGASAGNVNGLLSAVEACAGTAREPEQSLFWRMWVHTGIEQLMNEQLNDDRNRALFHRDFLNGPVFGSVVKQMNQPGSGNCDIPVGLSLTRVVPDSVVLDPDSAIWIPTQRFVAAYRVRRAADGRLQFIQPHPGLHADISAGELVIAPADGERRISGDSILKFVSASGAFPFAFEPVVLTYLDRDSLNADWECRSGSECKLEATFVDGGAFDNNPLALALSLFLSIPGTDSMDERVRLVYIDASLTRDSLHTLSAGDQRAVPAPRGLAGVLDVALPLITSARKYELHSLSRSLAQLGPTGHVQRNWLRATSRSQPIFGEHLGAFGAFLGSPLREYDFYAGMYDGLRFAAQDLLCAGRADTAQDRACIAERTRDLLRSPHIPVGRVAPRALWHFFRDEYPNAAADDPATLVVDTLSPGVTEEHAVLTRARILDALLTANHRVRYESRWSDTSCARYRWQERLTCIGGFAEVLRIAATPEVRKEVALWTREPACSWARSATAPESCPVDGTFQRLLVNPEEFTVELTDRVVHQLWRVEDALGWDTATARYSRENLIEWGEMLYRGVGPRRAVTFGWRRGWDLDPSSIQTLTEHKGRRLMQFPVPYGLSWADGNGVELSYRPTLYPSRQMRVLSVILPASVTARSGGTYDLSGGLGIRLTPETLSPWVSSIEAAWQPLHSFDPGERAHGSLQTGTLTLQLIADRLRLGIRYLDDPDPAFNGGHRVWYSLGIADFNGLMYWMRRTQN